MMRRAWFLAVVLPTFLAHVAAAQQSLDLKPGTKPIAVAVPNRNEPVSYSQEIADILDAKCVGCHSGALSESKLNLEDVPGMLKGGKKGSAIVAGKADESLLFKLALRTGSPVMPPKDKKDQSPLTPDELGLLKLWIDAGARTTRKRTRSPRGRIELGSLRRCPADRRCRHHRRRCPGCRRPSQCRAGLRRRLRTGDHLARRSQGHHPIAPVQPRRQASGRG